jgi:hypothetical protein
VGKHGDVKMARFELVSAVQIERYDLAHLTDERARGGKERIYP